MNEMDRALLVREEQGYATGVAASSDSSRVAGVIDRARESIEAEEDMWTEDYLYQVYLAANRLVAALGPLVRLPGE